jgi:hypothetical protein
VTFTVPTLDGFPLDTNLELTALADRMTGRLATPADPDWDTVRSAWNLAVDQRPDAVAMVADVADVQAVIATARATARRVAPQGTGHNASALGDLAGSILLRTDLMRDVTIDPARRSARVGAGVLWGEVVAAAAEHGLTALAGSSADVGVVGYTLGGGFSWFARSRGVAANHVTAIELVTGDGRFRRVSAAHDPEVFWAVRGGGGNFGVVTALEFDLFERQLVYAGSLFFPLDRAREILVAYRQWSTGLTEAATTSVRLLRVPPLPDVPEPLRGKAFVVINGVIDLPVAQAESLLSTLRSRGPAVDMWGPLPTSALVMVQMDPPHPVPGAGDGMNLADLSDDVIDALLEVAGPDVADCPLLSVDLRQLGGAAGRPVTGGGVVDHFAGEYLLFAVGIAATPDMGAAVHGAVVGLLRALAPHAAERDYLNFRESAVEPATVWGAALPELRAIKAVVDPADLIRSNHSL